MGLQSADMVDRLMTEDFISLVREHQASDPQPPRYGGDGCERSQRGQLMAKGLGNEMVPDQDGGKPSVLGPSRCVQQGLLRSDTLSEHSETKGA